MTTKIGRRTATPWAIENGRSSSRRCRGNRFLSRRRASTYGQIASPVGPITPSDWQRTAVEMRDLHYSTATVDLDPYRKQELRRFTPPHF